MALLLGPLLVLLSFIPVASALESVPIKMPPINLPVINLCLPYKDLTEGKTHASPLDLGGWSIRNTSGSFYYSDFDGKAGPEFWWKNSATVTLPGPADKVTLELMHHGSAVRIEALNSSEAVIDLGVGGSAENVVEKFTLSNSNEAITQVWIGPTGRELAIKSLCYVPAQPKPGPDLTVAISGPATAIPGQEIGPDLSVVVTNDGDEDAPGTVEALANGYVVDIVLSTSTNLPVAWATYSASWTDGQLLLGGRVSTTTTLAPGANKSYKVGAKIPANTPPGTYCLGAVVDPGKKIAESNEKNNTACHMIEIKKPLPNLQVDMSGPNSALPGQLIDVKIKVKNIGYVAAPGATAADPNVGYSIDVVLSKDETFPSSWAVYSANYAEDVLLLGGRVSDTPPLAPGAQTEFSVSVKIPDDTPLGQYCLAAIADPGRKVVQASDAKNWDCQWLQVGKSVAPVACTTAPFADVPANHPACSAIKLLVDAKVVNGLTPTQYGPDQPVTRSQMAKLLVEALGLPLMPGAPTTFTDVASHWAFTGGWGQRAATAGMINGYPDLTFKPDVSVKRSEAIRMAAGAAQMARSNGTTPTLKPVPNPALQNLTDVPADAWYHEWVVLALRADLLGSATPYGLLTGSSFGGEKVMTRAEAALLLANLLAFRGQ